MEKQTKRTIIMEFIEDINSVMRKVDINTADAQDYQRLQEYFELSGIEQSLIDSILTEGNFDGWVSFEKARKEGGTNSIIPVRTTLGAIKGIHRAVIQLLTDQANQD